jgi:hypothetical protein
MSHHRSLTIFDFSENDPDIKKTITPPLEGNRDRRENTPPNSPPLEGCLKGGVVSQLSPCIFRNGSL